jgi:23S rRNA (adenine2030-N6)-methyltransferase
LKHAVVLVLIERLLADPRPLQVIDTHAGAGLYDLEDERAQRSGEADAGIARLMADAQAPAVFAPLKAMVAAVNAPGVLKLYPGSPLLIAGRLRRGDRYRGYELRSEDREALHGALRARVPPAVTAEAVLGDGYAALEGASRDRRSLYLIDPPFERGDDYERTIQGVNAVRRADPDAVIAIWVPLKDLETFDAFLRGLEAFDAARLQVAEVRLRPLTNPMKMNGCAMVLVGGPDLIEPAASAAEWIAAHCGEAGARGRAYGLPDG